jgi:pimeloyl-ACP methyl ester carboxylesterase
MKARALVLALIWLAGSGPAPTAAAELRTIEGAPEGGLAYRLTLNAGATPEKPDCLVIWLHPSGGLMTDALGEMAPLFARHGFALLVMTNKQTSGWTDAEAGMLLARTLPDVAKVGGLDAARPVLFGFSGGGQLAMALWHARPRRYGGIIVDAAYPLEERDGKNELMELPSEPAVKEVPLFVLVGSKDPVAVAWRKVESKWRNLGLPLTIRYVSGKRHEWLFAESETAELETWLDALAKRMSTAAPPRAEVPSKAPEPVKP